MYDRSDGRVDSTGLAGGVLPFRFQDRMVGFCLTPVAERQNIYSFFHKNMVIIVIIIIIYGLHHAYSDTRAAANNLQSGRF